jgi:hypothetical protein
MSDAFELQGFDEFYSLLDAAPRYALLAAKAGMQEALLTLHDAIPEYPNPPSPDAPSPLVTPLQRRWFFWAVRAGKVPGWQWVEDERGGHPEGQYRRTGTLGRQITEEVRLTADGVEGEIGTATPYAPWVIGPDYPGEVITGMNDGDPMYQARIHANRWWQFDEVIEQNIQSAWDEFVRAFFTKFDQLVAAGR